MERVEKIAGWAGLSTWNRWMALRGVQRGGRVVVIEGEAKTGRRARDESEPSTQSGQHEGLEPLRLTRTSPSSGGGTVTDSPTH